MRRQNKPSDDRRINTGGGDYIEGDVRTGGGDFVGHDKIIHVDSQQTITLERFVELLAQIQGLLAHAELDEETVQEVAEDIAKVQEQASRPQPNKGIILKRLNSVVEFLTSSTAVLTEVTELYDMVQKAVAWATRLFR